MATCRKCKKDIQDGSAFCNWCGAKQGQTRGVKRRGNGQGSAYKRGGTWTAVVVVGYEVKEDGHQVPIRKTKSGFKTKTAALEYCPKLFEPRSASLSTRFIDVFTRWAERHADRVSKVTMRNYTSSFAWFKPIHHVKMQQLTADDLQDCLDKCTAGKRTHEMMKTTAGLVCKYAMDSCIIQRNIAENLFTGRGKKGTRPAFTREEVEQIRQAIGIEPYADVVYCMIYTGFRPSELLNLKKASYNAEEHYLIGGGKTKAGTNRVVPVSPKIQPILELLMGTDGEYLFTNKKGKHMTAKYFSATCFKPLMEKLGIRDRSPYSCRHTFANLLKLVPGSDTDKAAIMGHADASMTKYYQSEEYGPMKKIIDSI